MKNIGDDARIPISDVAARYGRHVRTLERWIDDPSVAFPKPVYIRRQRYIRAGDLKAWEESQAA
jgi:hypothetical protein